MVRSTLPAASVTGVPAIVRLSVYVPGASAVWTQIAERPGDVIRRRQRLRAGQQVGPAIAGQREIVQVEAVDRLAEHDCHLRDVVDRSDSARRW